MPKTRIFLSICLSICTFFLVSAQSGTTEEEYRYMTKGFAYQHELGLDTEKDGYTLKKMYLAPNAVRFVGMYGEEMDLRGIIVVIPGEEKDRTICLPNERASKEIIEQYFQDRGKLTTEEENILFEGMRAWMFDLINQKPEMAFMDQSVPIFAMRGLSEKQKENKEEIAEEKQEEVETKKEISIPDGSKYRLPKSEEKPKINENVAVELKKSLKGRVAENIPPIMEPHQKKGKVVVKLCLDANGRISKAKFTQRGSNTFNSELRRIALNHAKKITFAESTEKEECGTIEYVFE